MSVHLSVCFSVCLSTNINLLFKFIVFKSIEIFSMTQSGICFSRISVQKCLFENYFICLFPGSNTLFEKQLLCSYWDRDFDPVTPDDPARGERHGVAQKAFCFSSEFCLSFQLLISAWLTGLGGLLRNISTLGFVPRHHGYAVLLTGQILAACAQPFVLFAPTKLAAVWFQENRRATTNMVGSMSKWKYYFILIYL